MTEEQALQVLANWEELLVALGEVTKHLEFLNNLLFLAVLSTFAILITVMIYHTINFFIKGH